MAASLLVALLALAAPCRPPSAAPTGGSPFVADERFRKPVMLQVREQPLGEFLDGLRKEQGLPVQADATTQDDRVTVFCRARPAGEILATVARVLEFTWVRRRAGEHERFVLLQTAEQRRQEERERAAYRERALAGLRREVDRELALARRTPAERREQRRQRVLLALQRSRFAALQQYFQGELDDLNAGIDRWSFDSVPETAAQAALLTLTPAQWERLWRGELLRLAYPSRPGRETLGESEATAIVRTAAVATALQRENGRIAGLPHFDGVDRVAADLWVDAGPGLPTLSFRCRYVARRDGDRVRETLYRRLTGEPDHAQDPETDFVDLKDVTLRHSYRFAVAKRPSERPDEPSFWLLDVMDAVAKATPYTLVGDSYDDSWGAVEPPSGTHPLGAWLRKWCPQARVVVRREGATLTFRHRDYAWRRPWEPPARLTRPWEERLRKERFFRLRDLIGLARTLSPGQFDTAQARWRHADFLTFAEEDNLYFNSARTMDALRWVGALDAEEMAMLLRGDGAVVPLARVGPLRLFGEWSRWPVGDRDVMWGDRRTEPGSSATLLREFDAELAAEERGAGVPPGRYGLRLVGETGPFYYTNHVLSDEPSRDPQRVLRHARRFWPQVTERDVRRFDGTQWRLQLLRLQGEPGVLNEWGFVTPDLPSGPRRVG